MNTITTHEFGLFKNFIYEQIGVALSDLKMPLVSGRLSKRVAHYELGSFLEYFKYIQDPMHADEMQVAIDLLTTNETHFFREPKHFEFFKQVILPKRVKGRAFRVWSAACSSGEEPYTIAMLLSEHVNESTWEIVASDVSTKVLAQARQGCYGSQRISEIPRQYLTKYCLKGTGDHEGELLMTRQLRQRVSFHQLNLTQPFPSMGKFDVIFLRNVMIYFDNDTKRKIVEKMHACLNDDGYLFISHSESLNGVTSIFEAVAPAIYQKAPRA